LVSIVFSGVMKLSVYGCTEKYSLNVAVKKIIKL